jgi:hypothetical protein
LPKQMTPKIPISQRASGTVPLVFY